MTPGKSFNATAALLSGTPYHAQRGPFGANGQVLYMNVESGGNTQRAKFQALCLALRPDLLRFAFWLSRDRALAEDVVQESLLRAWKAQDSLQDANAAKPWLLTIVRREYARTFERKRLPTVDIDDLVAREEPVLAGGDLAGGDSDDIAEVRRAMFKLPAEYREPLVLQVVMGLSTAEIAKQLGLSQPAVLTRLFRARNQLRSMLGEDTQPDPDR
jgi:RNA polymerase sigma-70 factor, ECF subfamily